MKYYAQYYYEHDGRTLEKLGSDGIYKLDGRMSLSNMIIDTIEHAYRLRKVATLTKFVIVHAQRFSDFNRITDFIKIV